MVLRSLCSPRKKQKVKMQMSKQTSDNRIPTHVITSRSRSCMLSAFCEKSKKRETGELDYLIAAVFCLGVLETHKPQHKNTL